jgi:filamentous hemagglutinin
LVDDAARAGATIFKSAHNATRLEKAGVSVARAESAVAKEVAAMRGSLEVGADVAGRMRIDKILVEYRARLLPDGSVNVGTIFPVKP